MKIIDVKSIKMCLKNDRLLILILIKYFTLRRKCNPLITWIENFDEKFLDSQK